MPVIDRLESIYDKKKYEEINIEKVIEDPLKDLKTKLNILIDLIKLGNN